VTAHPTTYRAGRPDRADVASPHRRGSLDLSLPSTARPGASRRWPAVPHERTVTLAREMPGAYTDGPDGANGADGLEDGGPSGGPVAERTAVLEEAVAGLVDVPVECLSESEIHSELAAIERATRRLEARTLRLAGDLETRTRHRARLEQPDDPRAGERAGHRLRRDLSNRLRWTPSRTKRTLRDAKHLPTTPAGQRAAERGTISARHAWLLADTLRHLPPGPQRDELESELVAAAADEDTVAFGRRCRRRLIEIDHDAAMEALNRQHAQRRAAVAQTDTGTLVLTGEWVGLDAEHIGTAVEAFRRPDRPGQYRTAEQRTADAIADLCAAALRAAEAPTRHGVRPHVIVTVPARTLDDGRGGVEAGWGGPLPHGEVRRLLDDAGVSWLLLDERGLPMEAGHENRNVPVGVWRAVLTRDKGCIRRGCDAPPSHCQVMHLATPYRLNGRLTVDTAALGCTHDHRLFDAGKLELIHTNGRPELVPPGHHEPRARGEHPERHDRGPRRDPIQREYDSPPPGAVPRNGPTRPIPPTPSALRAAPPPPDRAAASPRPDPRPSLDPGPALLPDPQPVLPLDPEPP
jgi:hypothetical protein